MNTVMTPGAVQRSYHEGKLKDLDDPNFAGDEVFLFVFPSPDLLNAANGDGDLLEVHDWSKDLATVWTLRREHKTTPDTVVWWR
jgi:hypothetical protein